MHVPIDTGLINHPKLKRLARLLEIPPVYALGHLILLWCWSLEYAEDGILEGFSAEDIAEAAAFVSDTPLDFHNALKTAGWLNGLGDLHAWEKHAGKTLKSREKANERKRRWLERKEAEEGQKRRRDRSATVPEPPDKRKRREREEKENKRIGDVFLPDWMPKDTWTLFLDHRGKLKAPISKRAYPSFLKKFEKLRGAGWQPTRVVDILVERGWRWFKPEWIKGDNAVPEGQRPEREPDKVAEWARDFKKHPEDYLDRETAEKVKKDLGMKF